MRKPSGNPGENRQARPFPALKNDGEGRRSGNKRPGDQAPPDIPAQAIREDRGKKKRTLLKIHGREGQN